MERWIYIFQIAAVVILIISLIISFNWLRLISAVLMVAALILTYLANRR